MQLLANLKAGPPPEPSILIARPSKWGNPFHIGKDGGRAIVIEKYRQWILSNPELLSQLEELRGKTLVCYCVPKACHGDVLLDLLNPRPKLLSF